MNMVHSASHFSFLSTANTVQRDPRRRQDPTNVRGGSLHFHDGKALERPVWNAMPQPEHMDTSFGFDTSSAGSCT